eukprot:scaffold7.g3552.t1
MSVAATTVQVVLVVQADSFEAVKAALGAGASSGLLATNLRVQGLSVSQASMVDCYQGAGWPAGYVAVSMAASPSPAATDNASPSPAPVVQAAPAASSRHGPLLSKPAIVASAAGAGVAIIATVGVVLWLKFRLPKGVAPPGPAKAPRRAGSLHSRDLEAGLQAATPKFRQPLPAPEIAAKPGLQQSITSTFLDVQAHAAALPQRSPALPPAVARTMVLLQQREAARSQQAAQQQAVQAYLRSRPHVVWEDEVGAGRTLKKGEGESRQALAAATRRRPPPPLPHGNRGSPFNASLSSEITPADDFSMPHSSSRASRLARPAPGQVEQLQRAAARVQPGSPRFATIKAPFATRDSLRQLGAGSRPQLAPATGRSAQSSDGAAQISHLARSASVPTNALHASMRTATWVASAGHASDAPQNTLLLELEQEEGRTDRLAVRVCDDGLALPTDERALTRVAESLGAALAAPCFESSTLHLRSTSTEETIIRCFVVHCPGEGLKAGPVFTGAEAKPPGSRLTGSQCSLTLLLGGEREAAATAGGAVGEDGAGGADSAALLRSADEVVACLEQLLGMLRVLGPPLKLMMRLRSVSLQDAKGAVQAVSGSKRLDLRLGPELSPLERLSAGLADEFGTDFIAEEQQPAAGVPPPAEATAAHAGGAGEAPGQQPAPPLEGLVPGAAPGEGEGCAAVEAPPLTYVGVGQAGWGCEESGAPAFRGSRWAARAGVVLRVPDHAARGQQKEAGSQAPQAPADRAAGNRDAPNGASLPPAALYLFRSWVLQLGAAQQQTSLWAIEHCGWGAFGFKLQGVAPGAGGAASLALACVQPESGAAIEAVVVHLQPSEAYADKPMPLSSASEARMVRGAVEAALTDLKRQCPAVVASRRDRCLMRALPTLARAVASILGRSATVDEGSASLEEQACAMLDCRPAELVGSLHSLLHKVATGSGEGGSAEGQSEREAGPDDKAAQQAGGSRRQRRRVGEAR